MWLERDSIFGKEPVNVYACKLGVSLIELETVK